MTQAKNLAIGGSNFNSSGQLSLTTGVTGILPAANGGTGGTSGQVYPGSGIANSTGTAWGTSYTTTGSGTVVALATSPSFTTPVLGTPTSGNFSTGTFTWPTFNQNTSGTAAGLSSTLVVGSGGTGATTLTGVIKGNGTSAFSAATSGTDYSAGTSVLTTGILKSTTTTGALTIAVAADFPTLNQNTTGSAGSVAAANITGTTLASGVTGSSLTSFGASIALGTPASGTLTNCTFPTLNQSTTGSAATFTSTTQNSQFNSVGVGTAGSATTGEIRATNNITAFYSSDQQFKENVAPIAGALSAVESIGGKTFDWTDAYLEAHGGADGYFVQKEDFGVIAQDVKMVFPLAVRTREDGSLAVDYAKLVALAFAAIVELNEKVKVLENK